MGGNGHTLTPKEEALKRLGLKKGVMDGVPRITERIVNGAGGIKTAIEALRGDDSEDAIAFIAKYDGVSPSDLERLTVEEIFTAAALTARRFIEVLTGALMQQSADTTKMMIAVAQPKVTEATIKAATDSVPIMSTGRNGESEVVGWTNGDTKAMEIFHKITGAMPTPKGAVMNFNQQNNTLNAGKDEADDKCEPPVSMDEYLMELQDVVRPKALSAPVETMPINAPHIEYMEIEV